MKQNLFNIQHEYLTLMDSIESEGGVITEEQENALKINISDRDSKTIAYCEVIGGKKSLNDRVDAEIKRLQAIKKTNNNVIKRLEENLLNAALTFGAFTVGLTKIGTRKSSTVEVEEVNSLPKDYKVIKVTEAADKAKIKKALQAGEVIEGCTINEKLNLKIN